jgi:hypothetical protein
VSASLQNANDIPTFELRKPSQVPTEDEQISDVYDPNRLSAFPLGDFRNSSAEDINDVKCEVMVNWLHTQQEEKQWLSGDDEEGVLLKKSKGDYACAPAQLANSSSLLSGLVTQLNVRVC